jgi:hypothetical protein
VLAPKHSSGLRRSIYPSILLSLGSTYISLTHTATDIVRSRRHQIFLSRDR